MVSLFEEVKVFTGKSKESIIDKILNIIVENNLPLVLKGGNALLLLLKENNVEINRRTKDIDLDITSSLSPEEILLELKKHLSVLPEFKELIMSREESLEKTLGLKLILSSGETLDFDINRFNNWEFTVKLESGLTCYSKETILADKFIVLSSKLIFRRIKDLIDIYLLSLTETESLEELKIIIDRRLQHKKIVLGDFCEFDTRIADLEKAYLKFKGLSEDIPFEKVYKRVSSFTTPLRLSENVKARWVVTSGVWIGDDYNVL